MKAVVPKFAQNESCSTIHNGTKVHTDEIQAIISKIPSWILRWGIMILAGILLIMIGLSLVIAYPDSVKASFKIDVLGNSNKPYRASVEVSSENIARIHQDQDVIITLTEFPPDKFGKLSGKIISVADAPFKDDIFLCNVEFLNNNPQSLIKIKQWMRGSAQIIVAKKSLFRRVYESFLGNKSGER